MKNNIIQEMKKLGLHEEYNKELFEKFKELILLWNEKMNLTRITEEDDIYIKHFLDSLTLCTLEYFKEGKIIDIGSGSGFPGIPLKIYNEKLDITLVDSLNKRITFLEEVISNLGLKNIRAIHGRAEEMARKPEYREQYDICTSRAVAPLNVLSEYSLPFVKVGGHFIAMKGSSYKEELEESKKAIEILGGNIVKVKEINLPGNILHTLIVVEKVKNTGGKYPRAGGKPRKQPLR